MKTTYFLIALLSFVTACIFAKIHEFGLSMALAGAASSFAINSYLHYKKECKNLQHKKAIDVDKASEIQQKYEGMPHGWIQWKGTDVCMDFHCKCGTASHIDSYFAYHVKCPKCGTVYMCNGHIELIELEQVPDYCVVVPELEQE